MRASTEELLYVLWFAADQILCPSWRNVGGLDFEAWAWRRGLSYQLAQLEKRRWLEARGATSTPTGRIVRLTEPGRLAALGGRDPEERWNRRWDGCWRVVLFDLPREAVALRARWHRLLRARHFGCLQGSVWITPDAVDDIRSVLAATTPEPDGFLVIEGRPVSGESDSALVEKAWDYREINRRYERLHDHLEVGRSRHGAMNPNCLRQWAGRELDLWREAVQWDPLLPVTLQPRPYLGRKAWEERCAVLALMARRFRPS